MLTLPSRADETPCEPVRSQWASQETKSRFWTTYVHEAAEHDGQILDKYKSDMDIVLIFAGLFFLSHYILHCQHAAKLSTRSNHRDQHASQETDSYS
jgi:hypothetical protein